ncbi:hypothetical protein HanIR_Chr10g0495241 [Helianthus annuus]|nr:hypothetical protein HanIR_Chr10g0495241 [Helianthus annuus]
MNHNNHQPYQHRNQYIHRSASQQKQNNRHNKQNRHNNTIINHTVEYHQRLITKKVQKQPCRHQHNEHDQRDRMP